LSDLLSPGPRPLLLLLALLHGLVACGVSDEPRPEEPLGLLLPRASISASELAVVVNLDDPLSAQIADYYMEARGIPADNRLELNLGSARQMSAADFAAHEESMTDAFGDHIQAIALTSMLPDRVGCMGASAAVALGFHTRYCASMPPCSPTSSVDYYDSDSTAPWTDSQLRPTMILAAQTLEQAQQLIERGLDSDATFPPGDGWFVNTTDAVRSVRWEGFLETIAEWGDLLQLESVDNSTGSGSDFVQGQEDVLFYFTGLQVVEGIESNTYRPGAVADHLTSFGGRLPTSSQMSILEWLEGGLTGSYGTAHEPCAFTSKFPDASALVRNYFSGQTLVEAYWKSVHMPGEGNFVGEPLARPWGGAQTAWDGREWTITTTALQPNESYVLEWSETETGPWANVRALEGGDQYAVQTINVSEPTGGWYRIRED
jgi:uncharacterized protein (TIGR03790 family)